MGFTLLQGIWYALKRHGIAIALVLVGLALLVFLGNALSVQDTLDLVFGGVIRVGLGVSAVLLILKFAFPKLHIQETIHGDPKAVALFCGCIAIAIALLF